jgi:hypothetical protein
MILISDLSPASIRSVFGIPSLRVSFTSRPSKGGSAGHQQLHRTLTICAS